MRGIFSSPWCHSMMRIPAVEHQRMLKVEIISLVWVILNVSSGDATDARGKAKLQQSHEVTSPIWAWSTHHYVILHLRSTWHSPRHQKIIWTSCMTDSNILPSFSHPFSINLSTYQSSYLSSFISFSCMIHSITVCFSSPLDLSTLLQANDRYGKEIEDSARAQVEMEVKCDACRSPKQMFCFRAIEKRTW